MTAGRRTCGMPATSRDSESRLMIPRICKNNGHFSIRNHHFSGAILHSLCIFNGNNPGAVDIFRLQLSVPGGENLSTEARIAGFEGADAIAQCGMSSSSSSSSSCLNFKIIILNTKFTVFNTQFIGFNAESSFVNLLEGTTAGLSSALHYVIKNQHFSIGNQDS